MRTFNNTFVFAQAHQFWLTEYGWGFFICNETPFSLFRTNEFNLPASLIKEGIVSRVHLWRPETKQLNLRIVALPHPTDNFHFVDVQYSPNGGTYYVGTTERVKMYSPGKAICNAFANYDETDQGGFV